MPLSTHLLYRYLASYLSFPAMKKSGLWISFSIHFPCVFYLPFVGGWTNPLWKICDRQIWIISPGIGMKINIFSKPPTSVADLFLPKGPDPAGFPMCPKATICCSKSLPLLLSIKALQARPLDSLAVPAGGMFDDPQNIEKRGDIFPWSSTWFTWKFSPKGKKEIPNLESIIFRFHV